MYASDLKHSSPALESKLARLYSLHGGRPIDLSFRTVYLDLLRAFGNPHLKLPPIIHVAGTNGKGSIVANLRAMLEEGGYRVHAYTSPHLIKFNERIRLNGDLIADDFLESLVDEAIELNGDNEITFFEITTALAFAAFARTSADILLLEVGLGGKFDCTNVIEKPLVSIISSIGYDHMEFLGDTLPKIATEKGGIIKPGCPCVISAQGPKSMASGVVRILGDIALKQGSPLSRHGAEWFTHDRPQDHDAVFNFVHKDVEMTLPRPNLQGPHQVTNSGAALAALQIIKDQFPVSEDALKLALRKIDWPGRLQNITGKFSIPESYELWLDGGHNEDAAYNLATQAAQWHEHDGKKLHLILGMMNRKDPVKFIGILQKRLASVTFVDIEGEPQAFRAADMKALAAKDLPQLTTAAFSDVQDALHDITARNPEPGRILIAGSLYLAGHVLKSCGKGP